MYGDVEYERITLGVGSSSGRCEFGIPSRRILIECKLASDRNSGKHVASELWKKIRNYQTPGYRYLFLFIYDPMRCIDSTVELMALEGPRESFYDVRFAISR